MPSSHQSLLYQYRYDALDRLIGHTPANEAQHQRFYCKSRLATEIQGALRHSIVQHGDLLLAQQQSSGNSLETRLLATDQQRSVLHVVSKAEQQQKSIAYSPYGHRQAENGLLSLLSFNGERPDPVTGHYFLGNGYRAFNPVLMRFNSPDHLSPFAKGGLNSYGYCWGDPINLADPTGKTPVGKIVSELSNNVNFIKSQSIASLAQQKKLHAIQERIPALEKKLETFISAPENILLARKNTFDALNKLPRSKPERLSTTATNTAIANNLGNPYAHIAHQNTFKPDYSAVLPTPQKKQLEFQLSQFNESQILNRDGVITGFHAPSNATIQTGVLPKARMLKNEINRLRNKYDADSLGDITRLPFPPSP